MRFKISFLLLVACSVSLMAQDNNVSETEEETVYAETFKSTRIMNGHSVESMRPGELDFRISHRFGTINSGAYNFFGLDQSNIHLGLEYGIFDWLMAGIGRASFEKTFDAFAKLTLLKQSEGASEMPFSLSGVTTIALKTIKFPVEQDSYFSSRLAFTTQVLVARKFSDAFSLQLMPSYVHRNLVATELDPNDLYSIGAGGSAKLSNRITFNAEYYYLINPKEDFSRQIYNPLSVGFDIETRGHVFQLIFTNSLGMIEKSFIGETEGTWTDGDIHFGFNISRVFTLDRRARRASRW